MNEKNFFDGYEEARRTDRLGRDGETMIAEYVNSRDVADFLLGIRYEFSLIEAAWLIFHCKNLTMEERHNAWMSLRESYSDVNIDLEYAEYKGSLFSYVEGLIARENKLVSLFFDSESHATYSYSFYDGKEWIDDDDVFESFEDCFDAFGEDMGLDPKFVSVVKKYTGRLENKIVCRLTVDKRPVEIVYDSFVDDLHLDASYEGFDGSLFYHLDKEINIPTPFKEGDIIECVGGKYSAPSSFGGRFVLARSGLDAKADTLGLSRYLDEKSACPEGYFILEDLGIYRTPIYDALDYEYSRDELSGEERFLTPLSKFLKGEMELGQLLATYKMTLGEAMAKKGREAFSDYN